MQFQPTSNKNVPSDTTTGTTGAAIVVVPPVRVKLSYGVANSAPMPDLKYEPVSMVTACAGPAAAAAAISAAVAMHRKGD